MTPLLPSTSEIDEIIDVNVYEESRLAELLVDVMQTYPILSAAVAMEMLKDRLTRLVMDGRLGLYEYPFPKVKGTEGVTIRLPLARSLELIASDRHWVWEPAPGEPLVFLFKGDVALRDEGSGR